jgi:hypothetical protein
MSAPTAGPTIAVQFDALDALAAELAALARELSDDAALCRATATSLYAALVGEEGWAAGSAATAWAALAEAVAARSGAVAGTLVGAVAAYRAADAALASRIGAGTSHERVGTR